MNQDFLDLLQALLDAGARFLVVGAHAMAVHGVPRATGDLDVWVDPDRANADRVWQGLLEFGAPVRELGLSREDLETPGMVVQLGLPPRRIDILTEASGLVFEEAWQSRATHRVGLQEVHSMSGAIAAHLRTLTGATCLAGMLAAQGCSLRKLAVNELGDALAESGSAYASDDDPELVREALPFGLKTIESLLLTSPRHRGLLTAAASGFTQYAYAFVQQDADEAEDRDLDLALATRHRAKRLFVRGRNYGLRGLDAAHPGLATSLKTEPAAALREANRDDVALLYWTAAAWGAAVSSAKDDLDLVADLPLVEALLRRALELDPSWESGALHELMIALEGGRPEAAGGSAKRAREHFELAVAAAGGGRAAPFVSLAEVVSVRSQDRTEFESLLKRALAIDPDTRPEWRLANLVAQRRARWLLGRTELIFAE